LPPMLYNNTIPFAFFAGAITCSFNDVHFTL
jgi:hypothetical protein